MAPVGSLSSPRLDDGRVAVGACELALDRVLAGEFAGTDAGRLGLTSPLATAVLPATPPWCEQAPRPAMLVVPSVQVTLGFAASLAAFFAAAVAFASTPPCCEQAPRPTALELVPSLHIVA